MGDVAIGIEERVWSVVTSRRVCVNNVIIVFVVAEMRRRRNIIFFQVGQILSERRGVVDIGDKDAAVATVIGGGGEDYIQDWL